MQKILLYILQFLAKLIIKKHKPFVIGITGTVGKTTTAHFVYHFLHNLYWDKAYMSEFDYNWEFWLPLTILQSKSANKNIFLWFLIFLKWLILIFKKNYPTYLVLEYWVDHKEEMDFLLKIVKPDISIILNISQNHVMQFPNFNDYIKEKLKLPLNSKNIIYNSDDENLEKNLSNKKNIISYWIKNKNAKIQAFKIKSDLDNLNFILKYWSQNFNLKYNLAWDHQVYNILPTFCLWILLWINIDKIIENLVNIYPQKWRWTILKWIKNSLIIDWSYNWWFTSISAWINYINKISLDYNKILFLWDMRELWNESKKIHLNLASLIKKSKANYVILVWSEMNNYIYNDLQNSFKDKIYSFLSSKKAWLKIREIILQNSLKSVIFVKWSQNTIFLEEWIKEFLFDLRDQEKLCRQSRHWLNKKEEFFNNIICN